jgi:hypothetical protein
MRAGLELWARDARRRLELLDDCSSAEGAVRAVEELAGRGCEIVLGPYGSDCVRAVAGARAGALVWNHGGAADDVQRLPGVVSVCSPASRYLVAVARAAVGLGASRVAVETAGGTFARLAREELERESASLGVDLVLDPGDADCVLLCGPVEWEAGRFRALERQGVLFGGVSPGLPRPPHAWPDGTLAPVQWHPDLGGPAGLEDYVAAQAYAAGLIAERCLAIDREDPLSAARSLSTTTFFGPFELDGTGLQTGHQLHVVQWRGDRQELVL